MAINIYSPLLISSVAYLVIFAITMIVLFSVRFNEGYINKQVENNSLNVPIKSTASTIVTKPASRPKPVINNNAYSSTRTTQRQS